MFAGGNGKSAEEVQALFAKMPGADGDANKGKESNMQRGTQAQPLVSLAKVPYIDKKPEESVRASTANHQQERQAHRGQCSQRQSSQT